MQGFLVMDLEITYPHISFMDPSRENTTILGKSRLENKQINF